MSDRAEEVTSSFNHSSVTHRAGMNGSSVCGWVDGSASLFFVVVYALLFLVGFLLNSFIVRFYFCRAQQKASGSIEIYLKNLAAADFLLCLCLPIRIAHYAGSSIAVRSVNCNFGASVLFLNMYASILFMGYIAANRYLKVVHPSGKHMLQSVRVAHTITAVTWVLLLTVSGAFVILSYRTQKPPGASVPVLCEDLHSSQLTLLFKIIHICCSAMFLSVLVALLFFYHATSRRVSEAQRTQPASSASTKLAKSRRNMLVLVGVFCVCFVPYHLVRLPKAFLPSCSWSFYVLEVSILMSVLNVCLDPVIYFILCKRFRAQLRPGAVCGNS